MVCVVAVQRGSVLCILCRESSCKMLWIGWETAEATSDSKQFHQHNSSMLSTKRLSFESSSIDEHARSAQVSILTLTPVRFSHSYKYEISNCSGGGSQVPSLVLLEDYARNGRLIGEAVGSSSHPSTSSWGGALLLEAYSVVLRSSFSVLHSSFFFTPFWTLVCW